MLSSGCLGPQVACLLTSACWQQHSTTCRRLCRSGRRDGGRVAAVLLVSTSRPRRRNISREGPRAPPASPFISVLPRFCRPKDSSVFPGKIKGETATPIISVEPTCRASLSNAATCTYNLSPSCQPLRTPICLCATSMLLASSRACSAGHQPASRGRLARCRASFNAHGPARQRSAAPRASPSGPPHPGSQPGPWTPRQQSGRVRRRDVAAGVNDPSSNGTSSGRSEPPVLDVVTWINLRLRKALSGGDTSVLVEAGTVGLVTGSAVVLFNEAIHLVRPPASRLAALQAQRAQRFVYRVLTISCVCCGAASPPLLGCVRVRSRWRGSREQMACGARAGTTAYVQVCVVRKPSVRFPRWKAFIPLHLQ